VYGRTGGAELLIATVPSPGWHHSTVSYSDTGAVTPAGAMPTTNTTGAFDCGIFNLKIEGDTLTRHGHGVRRVRAGRHQDRRVQRPADVDNVWIDQVGAGMLSRGAPASCT
jgi:hypothetical protein